jgi:DNA-binding transcriptional MerR regulator
MKTKKLIEAVYDFFELKPQKREVEKLEELKNDLKEKRKRLSKKLKEAKGSDKKEILSKLQTIDKLRKKTKSALASN